jgi:hypothetical protein
MRSGEIYKPNTGITGFGSLAKTPGKPRIVASFATVVKS